MNRRNFLKTAGATAAAGLLPREMLAGPSLIPAVRVTDLPVDPGFKTKHLVVVLYGNGCRKKDTVENPALTPHHAALMKQGTVFTEDFGDTANLHGYMYTEMLTGRETVSEHPLYPTWNEYVRKALGGPATDYWMVQGVSYYRSWVWDRKHWSAHPDFGLPYGANNITINKLFYDGQKRSPAELTRASLEEGLSNSSEELARVEGWIDDVLARKTYVPASTKTALIDREVPTGDAQCFQIAKLLLSTFKPKLITLQILALDDAHADGGFWDYDTDFEQYLQHLAATDELIGDLWKFVQSDPYLRETTSLLLRPECGRDDEVNVYGQLHHSTGNYYAHNVWTLGVGPDFKAGAVFPEKVMRRDLAPTVVYLMTGRDIAAHSTGSVRTQMFRDEYRLPKYVRRDRFGNPVSV
jgi:hypothetical protein